MSDQEMCCGGTCVRAVCEYHRASVGVDLGHGKSKSIVRASVGEWRLLSDRGIVVWASVGEWRLLSDCGHYVQIWRNSKLVDEVPV